MSLVQTPKPAPANTLKPQAQRPYNIKASAANYFETYYNKDQVKKVDKQPYIGDTSVAVKNGRELLRGRRLRKINVIDEKLSPS